MIEILNKLIDQGYGGIVIIVSLLICGLMALAIHAGYITIKTKKVLLGKDYSERERLIIKKQIEFAHHACMAFEKKIPRFEGYNEYIGKYIAELAFDEIVNWISINHITNDEDYIEIKQRIIWDILITEAIDDRVKTDKVKKIVYANTKEIIERLVQIRENDTH